jgi:hypothetical protein
MRKLTILLLAAAATLWLGDASRAQTGGPAPQSGTRLITVGTAGGPARAPRGRNPPICWW